MIGPTISFFLMVTAAALGVFALSFILIRRLFPEYKRKSFSYGFWTVNLLTLLGTAFGRGRLDNYSFSAFLIECAVVWFMAQVFVILLTPVFFAAKKFVRGGRTTKETAFDPGRRRLLKGLAVSLPAAAIGIGSYGTFYASRDVRLLRHAIMIPSLAKNLDGFKIAQISDAHIGLFFSPAKLQELLSRLLEEGPDLLAITGDLIDDIASLTETVRILDAYSEKFPRGIWFSWGNHEYFRDFAAIEKALSASKVHILRNENALLSAGAPPLYLLGVDYPWAKAAAGQRAECARMMEDAMDGIPADAVKILMTHHPAFIDNAYEKRVDLTLAGHTHGGQVAFLGQAILPVRYKYMRGMYAQEQLRAYVSAGSGSWFPFRLGCPAEASVFVLRCGGAS